MPKKQSCLSFKITYAKKDVEHYTHYLPNYIQEMLLNWSK